MTIRVAIDGVGGVGRQFVLAALESGFADLFSVTTILEEFDIQTVLQRLAFDSQYGRSRLPLALEDGAIVAGEQRIEILEQANSKIPDWEKQNVDVVVTANDNRFSTGRNAEHLKKGAKKVLSIGDSDGSDIAIVPGVNEATYSADDHVVVSTGTSVTIRIATMLSVLRKLANPKSASCVVVHPPGSNSTVVDRPGSLAVRSRSVAGNILPVDASDLDVITAKSFPKIPIVAQAVVVPTSGAGWISCSYQTDSSHSQPDLAAKLAEVVQDGEYLGLLAKEESALTARDVFGTASSLVFDNDSSGPGDGGVNTLSAWFDADWSLACRGVDVLALVCESGVPGTA